MKSPCYSCPRLNEDKRVCCENCEALDGYQKILFEEDLTCTMKGINYELDMFGEPSQSLEALLD